MLFHKFIFGFLLLSIALALPFRERSEDYGTILPRAPLKLPAGKIVKALAKSATSELGKSTSKAAPAKSTPRRAINAPAHPTTGKTNNAPTKPTPGKATDKPAKSTTDKAPGKKFAPVLYTGNSVEDRARKANNAPGRTVPKPCKTLAQCDCHTTPNSKSIQSTSCINGFCSCNNAAVNFMGKEVVQIAKAVGEAPVVQAVGQVMKTIADIKQVASTVVGAVFGPEAKYATKLAMFAMPDVGPSHIDDATHGVASAFLR